MMFEKASSAVTVTADVLEPLLAAMVPGTAATVDWLAETAAGFTAKPLLVSGVGMPAAVAMSESGVRS